MIIGAVSRKLNHTRYSRSPYASGLSTVPFTCMSPFHILLYNATADYCRRTTLSA